MVEGVEDAETGVSRGGEDAEHIRNALIGLGNGLDAVPDLAAFGDEIVIGIDYEKRGEILFVSGFPHSSFQYDLCRRSVHELRHWMRWRGFGYQVLRRNSDSQRPFQGNWERRLEIGGVSKP